MDKILNFNSPVAENLTRIIDEKGLIQKVVAERADLTPQSLCDVIYGRRILKVSEVKKLADALDVSIDELFKSG